VVLFWENQHARVSAFQETVLPVPVARSWILQTGPDLLEALVLEVRLL